MTTRAVVSVQIDHVIQIAIYIILLYCFKLTMSVGEICHIIMYTSGVNISFTQMCNGLDTELVVLDGVEGLGKM